MLKAIRDFFADQERVSRLFMGLAVAIGLGSVLVLIGAFIFIE